MGTTGRNTGEPVKRWKVTIWYPRGNGFEEEVEFFVEELGEIENFVKAGENFYSISRIEIVLNDDCAVQMGYRRIAR